MGLWCVACDVETGRHVIDGDDNGTRLSLAMDQEVELTLQTVGPGQYDEPVVSSSALDFISMRFADEQNPGGPTQVYRFRTIAAGEATVTIPHSQTNPTFTFTTSCCAQ